METQVQMCEYSGDHPAVFVHNHTLSTGRALNPEFYCDKHSLSEMRADLRRVETGRWPPENLEVRLIDQP